MSGLDRKSLTAAEPHETRRGEHMPARNDAYPPYARNRSLGRARTATLVREHHHRRARIGMTMTLGLLLAFVFFGGFGAWAVLAPLKGAVVATGTVKVRGDRKEVEHLEGGILREVHVADGDRVTTGQLLFVLDDTRLLAARTQLEARLLGAAARGKRLAAEKAGHHLHLDTPADAELAGVVGTQQELFATRTARHHGALVLLDERIAQVRQEIVAHEAQNRADRRQLEYLDEEVRDADTLLKKGLQRKPRWLALKRQQEQLRGQISQRDAQIARARQEISRIEQQKLQLARERDDDIAKENREVTDTMVDLRQRIAVIAEQMDRLKVRAPANGTVIATGTKTVGAVIGPGERLLEIVPADASLVVEARIAPKDIESVHPGANARIRLTAYNARRTPPVAGRLALLAADRQEDMRTGQPYYRAELTIDRAELAAFGLALMPGMAADVMIETRETTLFDYMLGPLTASFEKALREHR